MRELAVNKSGKRIEMAKFLIYSTHVSLRNVNKSNPIVVCRFCPKQVWAYLTIVIMLPHSPNVTLNEERLPFLFYRPSLLID